MKDKKDIAKKVMLKIKKDNIKIHSKYLVGFMRILKLSAFVLLLSISAVFLSFIIYWLKTTQNLDFLTFGRLGVFAFVQSFPISWFLIAFFFYALSGYVIKAYDISYQKPYKLLLTLVLVFTGFYGSLISVTGADELIIKKIIENSKGKLIEPYLKSIYNDQHGQVEKNGVVGEVIKVDHNTLRVCVNEHSIDVIIAKESSFSAGQKIKENDWVRVVGEKDNGSFQATKFRKMEPVSKCEIQSPENTNDDVEAGEKNGSEINNSQNNSEKPSSPSSPQKKQLGR
ncbi:hypothetical protein ACFLZ1_03590 [Patescibacteria group bacterium]